MTRTTLTSQLQSYPEPVAEQDLDQEVAELLRIADQRYTTGRRRLVAVLDSAHGPLTIGEIIAADTTQAQSSVYRNLTVLEDAGAVTRVITKDEFARYELAEQFTHHHHHLICNSCGSVQDVALDAATEKSLDRALHKAAAPTGFQVEGHQLDLLGLCASCV